jgi:biopolymer transport protein ExbD
MRQHFPKSRLICRIGMIGFLAIQIVLLVMFFPLSTDVRTALTFDVSPPRAERPVTEPRAIREDALYVAIAPDKTVWFDQEKVPVEKLAPRIRNRVIRGAEPKVYFRVDRRAPYGAVLEALAEVRKAEIRDVAFIAEAPRPRND